MLEGSDSHPSWQNGITLKRTRDGYAWTIGVSSASADVAGLRAAMKVAMTIDAELAESYGELPKRGSAAER